MEMRGIGREVLLVDRDTSQAEARAADILQAVLFAHTLKIHTGGYEDLIDSRIVIITSGVVQITGESRLDLLRSKADIFEKIVPLVPDYTPGAILLVATNPVDVMTHFTARLAAE